MELTLEEIARASSGKLFCAVPHKKIKGVSIDSRTISPGELFIPLKGERSDGHNFLKEVKKKAAIATLVRENFPLSGIPPDFAFVRVKEPVRALGEIAGFYRLKFNIPLIAVTGSCGKTTVKEMIASILFTEFQGIKTEKNFNNAIGVPLMLFRLKKSDEVAILELGTNSPGEIAYLTRITRPSIGLITNINPVHLEGLSSLRGIAREKEGLLLNLPPPAKAVLNWDDKNLRKMGEKFSGSVLTFGLNKKADFWPDDIRLDGKAMSFRLNGNGRFLLNLLGRANIYNALGAIAVASLFNVSLKKIRYALEAMKSLPHRLELLKAGRATLIDDTYNANPASFRMAIDALTELGGHGRYIVVAGDMLELGKASSNAHFELGSEVARRGVDFLIAVGRWGKKIIHGARRGGLKKSRVFLADSPEDAAQIILKMIKPCDKILVKGSRKIGLERAINVLSSSLSSL